MLLRLLFPPMFHRSPAPSQPSVLFVSGMLPWRYYHVYLLSHYTLDLALVLLGLHWDEKVMPPWNDASTASITSVPSCFHGQVWTCRTFLHIWEVSVLPGPVSNFLWKKDLHQQRGMIQLHSRTEHDEISCSGAPNVCSESRGRTWCVYLLCCNDSKLCRRSVKLMGS